MRFQWLNERCSNDMHKVRRKQICSRRHPCAKPFQCIDGFSYFAHQNWPKHRQTEHKSWRQEKCEFFAFQSKIALLFNYYLESKYLAKALLLSSLAKNGVSSNHQACMQKARSYLQQEGVENQVWYAQISRVIGNNLHSIHWEDPFRFWQLN